MGVAYCHRDGSVSERQPLRSSRHRRLRLRLRGPSSRFSPVSCVPPSFARSESPQLLRSQGMRFVHRSDQSCRASLPALPATVRDHARQTLSTQSTGTSGVLFQQRGRVPVERRAERPRDSLAKCLCLCRGGVSVWMWQTLPATFSPQPRNGRMSSASARNLHAELD